MLVRTKRLTTAVFCLAGAALIVLQSFASSAPADAQRMLIDPATLLPSVDELPGPFTIRPLPQESTEEARVRLALRMFERNNPGSPPNVTRLVVTASAATDATTASGVLSSLRAQLEGRGWSFQRSDGLIGDETIVGRLSVGSPAVRPVERVMIAFRKGTATGSSDWEDYADLPNRDSALGVARIIEARINAAGLDTEPTPQPTTVPGIAPGPRARQAATSTSIPSPTATPISTPTSDVIRQLPR
jgi:hypothetical protein